MIPPIRLSCALFSVATLLVLPACGKESASLAPDGVAAAPSGSGSGPSPDGAVPDGGDSERPEPEPAPEDPSLNPDIPTASLYRGSSDLAPFVEKFVSDGIAQNVNLISSMQSDPVEIRIASLDDYGENVIGLCETRRDGRTVTFDPDFWNGVSDVQKEVLSHHELGHCILFRDHRSGRLESGDYRSIMNPIIMGPTMYQANYEYYLNELYTQPAEEDDAEELGSLSVDPSRRTFICDTTEL